MNIIKKAILAVCVFLSVSISFSYLIFRKIYWILTLGITGAIFLDVLLIDRWQRNITDTPGGGIPAGKSTVYEESAPYSSAIKCIIVLGFSVLAFAYSIAGFGHFFGLEKAPEQAQAVLLLAVMIYALAMWGFFSMKFRITNSGVEAAMPPFKYSVPFSDIKEVKTVENIPWYVGWGLRVWGRRLAFVSMRKSAVAIEKKRGFFRVFVLTTQNPEEFIKRLKERTG